MTTAGPAPVLGRYRLGKRLGTGGFGTVYAAHDERLDRSVAVKVIPAADAAPERARREALAAARLDHPAVVTVYDAGEGDGVRYLVSELVRGRTLDRLIADRALSDRDVLRIGLALADGLEHAHRRGVVHRDVKPQNVLVPDAPRSARGVAKLADFGVAQLAGDEPLTRTGDVVGTLAYMAPEQAAGERVDARADVYALALVLYEGLAGTHPVRASSPAATARRVGSVLPGLARQRPDLPEALCAAIDRALLPAPGHRGELADLAGALAGALSAVDDEGGTVAPHPLERRRGDRWPARAGAAAVVAALVAAAFAHAAPPPLDPALAALAAALAVVLAPRAGWLAAAAAGVVVLPRDEALLAAAALAPVPLVLARARGSAWVVPALAPLLGLASLALAYPALAGRARVWWTRMALGALGAWALVVAEPLLGRALFTGAPPVAASAWPGALVAGSRPATVAGTAALFGVAAALEPWLVRGRWLAVDVIAAGAWSAGIVLAAARLTAPEQPRGLAAAALVAAVIAVGTAGRGILSCAMPPDGYPTHPAGRERAPSP